MNINSYSLDILYGLNLDEYCETHNISIDNLINKTQKDIELLKTNYNVYRTIVLSKSTDGLYSNEYNIVIAISEAISKKQIHLKRLCSWKKDSKN